MTELLLVLLAVAVPAGLALLLGAERRRSSERLSELEGAKTALKRLNNVDKQNRRLTKRNEVLRERLTERTNELGFIQNRIKALSDQRDEARSFARHYRTRYFENGGGEDHRLDPEWITITYATSWPRVINIHKPREEGGAQG